MLSEHSSGANALKWVPPKSKLSEEVSPVRVVDLVTQALGFDSR